MKSLDAIKMVTQWTILFLTKVVLVLIGLPLVAIGLFFKREVEETRQNYTEFFKEEEWVRTLLPDVLWIFSNDRDGLLGDKRGWFLNYCRERGWGTYLQMWWWTAVRNPINNLGFLPFYSCDVTKNEVKLLGGSPSLDYKDIEKGWQWIKAGSFYYHFYYISEDWYIRIGHKIKLEHNSYTLEPEDPSKRLKNWTFRMRFNGELQ